MLGENKTFVGLCDPQLLGRIHVLTSREFALKSIDSLTLYVASYFNCEHDC